MIRRFVVRGLNGNLDYDIDFNLDLNIVTGKNGSGKTTLLKLIWYMLSPNIERTVPEVRFQRAALSTDEYSLDINIEGREDNRVVNIEYSPSAGDRVSHKVKEIEWQESRSLRKIEGINQEIMKLPSGSVFFPTFRRIEGGFSLEPDRRFRPLEYGLRSSIADAMSAYSEAMSVKRHIFVASLSTTDIEGLVKKQYADALEKTDRLHKELIDYIRSKMPVQAAARTNPIPIEVMEAVRVFSAITVKLAEIEEKRSDLMKPFSVLEQLVAEIFSGKGIRLSDAFAFGEAAGAISASILSAGEKQMLSFLCYNAFNTNVSIFIDEPELSLHIDWQRILLPTLLSQRTSNQFIISTHSPFIYSRYPEKEWALHTDKGACDV